MERALTMSVYKYEEFKSHESAKLSYRLLLYRKQASAIYTQKK